MSTSQARTTTQTKRTAFTQCDKAGLDLGLGLGSRLGFRLGLDLGLVLGS